MQFTLLLYSWYLISDKVAPVPILSSNSTIVLLVLNGLLLDIKEEISSLHKDLLSEIYLLFNIFVKSYPYIALKNGPK